MNARGSWRPHAEVPRKPEPRRVREGGRRGRGRAGSARAGGSSVPEREWRDLESGPDCPRLQAGRALRGKGADCKECVQGRQVGSWNRERERRGAESEGRRRGGRSGRGAVGVGGAGCGGGGKSRLSKSGAGPGSAWLLTWAVEAGKGARGKRRLVG